LALTLQQDVKAHTGERLHLFFLSFFLLSASSLVGLDPNKQITTMTWWLFRFFVDGVALPSGCPRASEVRWSRPVALQPPAPHADHPPSLHRTQPRYHPRASHHHPPPTTDSSCLPRFFWLTGFTASRRVASRWSVVREPVGRRDRHARKEAGHGGGGAADYGQ
jgi:hypothetical protein